MHTRMTVLQDLNESDKDIDKTIFNYWDSPDIDLDRYGIDYYTEVDIDQGLDILKHNYNISVDKHTNIVTFGLKDIVKFLNRTIREINTFMYKNKPVDSFVENIYRLQMLVQPEHPKILSSYFGLYDLLDFGKGMYSRMRREHCDKIQYKVYRCYDYHF